MFFIILFFFSDNDRLRKNLIGRDCAGAIKEFLAHTTLDSLV